MCKLLKEQGVEFVEGCDIVNRSNNPYVSTWIHDASDPFIADLVIKNNVDHIFHFAASAAIADSVYRPALFFYNNIGTTTKLLDNLIQKGWKGKFIFSSTSSVYGNHEDLVTEDSDKKPNNPYGASKLMTEQAITEICQKAGIDVVMFRYFNVAGAWDDVGDHSDAEHIIPKICNAAYHNKEFTINGRSYDTRDGTCVRDYTHVNEICHAVIQGINESSNQIENLGHGVGTTVKEMVAMFKDVNNCDFEVITGLRRAGDLESSVLSNPSTYMKKMYKIEDLLKNG
jgi:UDP-glucose 4-epimerase